METSMNNVKRLIGELSTRVNNIKKNLILSTFRRYQRFYGVEMSFGIRCFPVRMEASLSLFSFSPSASLSLLFLETDDSWNDQRGWFNDDLIASEIPIGICESIPSKLVWFIDRYQMHVTACIFFCLKCDNGVRQCRFFFFLIFFFKREWLFMVWNSSGKLF